MGVLLGATAIISGVHRSMSEDDCDELTAEMLEEWAATYRKNGLTPTLKINGYENNRK